jgi:hypothetical protein
MYGAVDSLVEAKFRIAFRDADGNIISTDNEDLYDEFIISIQGPEITTCADALFTDSTSTTTMKTIAFNSTQAGSWDEKTVEFETFTVKVEPAACKPLFELRVKDENGNWLRPNAFVQYLEGLTSTGKLTSDLSFNQTSSVIKARFTSVDIEELGDYFLDDNDEVVLNFRVYSLIPGSDMYNI